MITAVDSCVLLDILANDPTFYHSSNSALQQARKEGGLIISDLAVAEIIPTAGDNIEPFLSDLGIRFSSIPLETAIKAGQSFSSYLERSGKRGRIVADFLIGAHAEVHAGRLLTRDKGFKRDYFKNLTIWYPQP